MRVARDTEGALLGWGGRPINIVPPVGRGECEFDPAAQCFANIVKPVCAGQPASISNGMEISLGRKPLANSVLELPTARQHCRQWETGHHHHLPLKSILAYLETTG